VTSEQRRRLAFASLATVAVVALVVAIAHYTEWVEIDTPRDPFGLAQTEPEYRLNRLLHKLGVQVTVVARLERLPPDGATLVLKSWNWNAFPAWDEALRKWVERGGNLVASFATVQDRSGLGSASWIPVRKVLQRATVRVQPQAGGDEDDEDDNVHEGDPKVVIATRYGNTSCEWLAEPRGIAPAWPDRGEEFAPPADFSRKSGSADPVDRPSAHALWGCFNRSYPFEASAPTWALASGDSNRMVRVAVGSGSVTVLGELELFGNHLIHRGENALIAIPVLQARRGSEVWIVDGPGAAPILAWLWQAAPSVLLLSASALAFWLWRSAPRFGPRMEGPAAVRRSMAEQVLGTARFLAWRDPAALMDAQRRALDEAAAPRIRDWRRMTTHDRALALASATGLDAGALRQALAIEGSPGRRALARLLALLENARRILRRKAT
jgi:hypothetical protein